MLYLRLEDHRLILADYSRAATQQPDSHAILTLVEHPLKPGLSLPQNLHTARMQHEMFQKSGQMEVIVNGPTTLVPVSEYEDASESLVFKSCFSVAGENAFRVLADNIPQLRTMLIFGVRQKVAEAIANEFQDCDVHYTSATSLLLRRFALHDFPLQHRRIYLNCREGFMDVAAFTERQLAACCTYETSTPNDAVYYTLALSKALGFKTKETRYILTGNNSLCKETLTALQHFVADTALRTLTDEFGQRPITRHPAVPYDLGLMLLSH